jgi:hypothetical protein
VKSHFIGELFWLPDETVDMTTWHLVDVTTGHSNGLSEFTCQVAGYCRAKSAVSVVGLSQPLRLGSGQDGFNFAMGWV